MSRSRTCIAAILWLWLASLAAAAEPGKVDPTAVRALANAARDAVRDAHPDAAATLARADAASDELALCSRAEVETRLHVLRSRMLWNAARPAAPPEERAALARDLASVEAAAAGLGAVGPRAFATLYLAELAGKRASSNGAALQRGLALPVTEETFEAHARLQALLGERLDAAGRPAEATAALRRAVRLAARLRGRLPPPAFLALARPIHEALAGRLLDESARRPAAQASLLREVLDVLEDLKVAELREYFGDQCLLTLAEITPEIVPGTLLLYPVLLQDRVELIASRGAQLERIVVPIDGAGLAAEARRLRGRLQDPTAPRYRDPATKLYELLIRPLGDRLFAADLTLVFVPTGPLRGVPLAALYDAQREQFLIEQLPVSTLPSLRIVPPAPVDPRRARALLVGLTQSVQANAPLPAVERELSAAAQHFPSQWRVDAAFTEQGFEQALEERAFDIVHIATHGRFDAEAADSHLVTWDGTLALPRLAEIVARTRHRTSRPIALLTLSACETAVGDDRAVLGLAGVAVQSGARSAVATLWRVNDEAAAELFRVFYAELAHPGRSRSIALQRAQRALIEDPRFRHPIHWSAFLLINSWL